MNYHDPILREKLATQYVLGTLRHGAARRFERLMQSDESLRDLVHEIASQFAPLVELLPPSKPDDQVWARIEQKLFTGSIASTSSIDTKLDASNDWQNTFFKTWAIAASVALIVVAWQPWSISPTDSITPEVVKIDDVIDPLPTVVDPLPTAALEAYAAVLNSAETQRAAWLLTISPQAKSVVVNSIEPQQIDTDRSFELWVKVPQSESVKSMGLIPSDGKSVLAINDQLAKTIGESEFFGVSVEPVGGSPTGQPTTTPTYVGNIIRI